MGDRVAVMRKGELQQVAPPQELYDRPVNLFVGGFIGSPAMNMVEATLERSSDGTLRAVAGEPAARARRRDARRAARRSSGYEGKDVDRSASGRRTSRTPRSRGRRRRTAACAARSS